MLSEMLLPEETLLKMEQWKEPGNCNCGQQIKFTIRFTTLNFKNTLHGLNGF